MYTLAIGIDLTCWLHNYIQVYIDSSQRLLYNTCIKQPAAGMWYTRPKCNFTELLQDFLCPATGRYIGTNQVHELWPDLDPQDDTLLF